jgi:hypothetical protein
MLQSLERQLWTSLPDARLATINPRTSATKTLMPNISTDADITGGSASIMLQNTFRMASIDQSPLRAKQVDVIIFNNELP